MVGLVHKMADGNQPALHRLPPQNLEAEQMVLGAILLDAAAVMPTAKIRPEDFYRTAHGKIYAACKAVYDKGESVDIVTVPDVMRNSDALEEIGGASYLSLLVSIAPTTANFKSHERLVITAAILRRTIRVCHDAQEQGYAGDDPEAIISGAISKLNDIRSERGDIIVVPYRQIARIGLDAIERNFEAAREGKLIGITTGFEGVNKLTNGLQPSWFYVFAGRTGKGKTSFAMQIARAAGKSGRKVGIISVEMDEEQLAVRDISSESDVPLSRLTAGALHDRDWNAVGAACGVLADLPLWGVFSAFTAEAVERAINFLVQACGVELVIVDYLQLLSIGGHRGTREQEVSEISRMHKRKAKEHRIPVVALAQLNRSVESRQDKRPVLSDLRESGSIEQDADVVAFIHHDECKCPITAECFCGNRYKAWYLQRKGRMNGTGDVPLVWHGRTTTFRDAGEE